MSNSRGTNVKKISTDRYESRLNDIATAAYYDRMVPYNATVESEAPYGHRLWHSEDIPDPWERLAWAVVSGAVRDYILCCIDVDKARDEFERGRAERERDAVASWFQRNDFLANIFDEVDRKVDEARQMHRLNYLLDRVRWCM